MFYASINNQCTIPTVKGEDLGNYHPVTQANEIQRNEEMTSFALGGSYWDQLKDRLLIYFFPFALI